MRLVVTCFSGPASAELSPGSALVHWGVGVVQVAARRPCGQEGLGSTVPAVCVDSYL